MFESWENAVDAKKHLPTVLSDHQMNAVHSDTRSSVLTDCFSN